MKSLIIHPYMVDFTYVALLSASEMGLGSLLHALHFPLAGHALSLNQGILLTFATRNSSVHPARISFIASILKSLSPAGKRLTPMLAISVQGFLFSFGLVFGRNALGIAMGMALLSLWAFAQPLILAQIIFGEALWEAIGKLWNELCGLLSFAPGWGMEILVAVVVAKLVLAIALGWTAWWGGAMFEEAYVRKLKKLPQIKPREREGSAVKGAFRDLLDPWFILSLLISGFYFWVSGKEVWLYLLRPLAIGWIVFWLIRSLPIAKWFGHVLEEAQT